MGIYYIHQLSASDNNNLINVDDTNVVDILTGNNNMKDPNYKGFLLMLTAGQRARLQTKANESTDGNITKLLQAYADNVEIK